MKCLVLLLILAINLYETQASHDYYHYQGHVPCPPGYVAEVEGECGCCTPPCCCVCVETSIPTEATTTTITTTTHTTLSTTPCVSAKFDLCFVVDSSGSVHPDDWLEMLWNITDIVTVLETLGTNIGETRVGMVTYGTNATLNWGLDSPETMSVEALFEAIHNVPHIGTMRNTADGLRVAATQVFNVPADRDEVLNACFVIVTGNANMMENQLPVYAEALKNASIVMVVKVGDEANFDNAELKLIASDDQIYRMEDFIMYELHEIIDGQRNCVEPIHPSVDPSPGPTKPSPPPEKECFCCCPPPPGYPDTCGFGHY